jgi:hypothetical protein
VLLYYNYLAISTTKVVDEMFSEYVIDDPKIYTAYKCLFVILC